MKKTDKAKGGDGLWFERGKHWCQYPIATGVKTRARGAEAIARRKAKRAYAKIAIYGSSTVSGFKGWLKEQAS